MPTNRVTTEATNGMASEKPKGQAPFVLNGEPMVQPAAEQDVTVSLERRAFVNGLLKELHSQFLHYSQLVEEMNGLQARVMISERNLRLTRDHLRIVLGRTEDAVPKDWEKVLAAVRFVGVRLGDACLEILRETPSLTTEELLKKLNVGQFRFRTGSPLREINAALLRNPDIKREGDKWIYTRGETPPPSNGVTKEV